MQREGEYLVIGTDGGLKDGVGTTGIHIEMKSDPSVNIQMMSG